jgi:hypothetical protein
MASAQATKAVEELIAPYPVEVQLLVLATREMVLKMAPAAVEQVDAAAKLIGIGFGTRYVDMICSIMPAKGWVTLGIAYGTQLPDPHKILEGTGKVHRHVKLRDKAELEDAALRGVLRASIARAKSAAKS